MTDLRQTPQYAKYMQILGWEVVLLNKELGITNYAYLKKIPIIGAIAKIQRPNNLTQKQILLFQKNNNLAVIYIEPLIHNSSFQILGFKHARSAFLPSKTIQIDLTKSEEQLLKEMKPKTRYNIGVAKKRGVDIKESADIEAFANLWKSSARRRLALPQDKEIRALWEAFAGKACLLLAYHDNDLVAGVLTVKSPDTAFYMYAGSTREGKKLFAPTLVAWEAIRLAKKLRCKTFDFEGIYDPRYSSTKSWRGFTKFKEGFGGKIVEFPKTLVYFQNPLLRFLNF
ncbi:MAG: femAB family protein [Microgenomates group bacterium Gr01-1014_5]|nr:MAG: femAB family protein [Microgenomates group bacterium Gr01-1014_5]